MHSRKLIICVPVFVCLLLALLLMRSIRTREKFATGLKRIGTTAHGYSLLSVSLTNESKVPVLFDGLQYQWASRSGHILGSHAMEPGPWRQFVPVKGVITTWIAVPEEANRVRVLLCGPPGPLENAIRKLPQWLRRIYRKTGPYEKDVHRPLPWIANPSPEPTAARPPALGSARRFAAPASSACPQRLRLG
jgi:hypothetical protein